LPGNVGFASIFAAEIDLASRIILIIIALYSFKLLLIKRNGALQKSSRFVSIGSVLFVTGVAFFGFTASLPFPNVPDFVFDLGGSP
jgi:hypothetical protein